MGGAVSAKSMMVLLRGFRNKTVPTAITPTVPSPPRTKNFLLDIFFFPAMAYSLVELFANSAAWWIALRMR